MDRDAVTELTTAPFRAIDPTALADALEGCGLPRSVLSVLDEHLVSLSIPVGDDDDA